MPLPPSWSGECRSANATPGDDQQRRHHVQHESGDQSGGAPQQQPQLPQRHLEAGTEQHEREE
ncbi:hypothetical protein [Streptomyces sp. TLI_185]|uniref:hypothetical protein n=1 Tax=Streptomyces sp. TLI_185 TaxID=2485151 RepID=UPI002889A280|nr:hypothetical protein [Streptomyces sp. TLI_185]